MQTFTLTEKQGEILEYVDKSNNEIAEDVANKKAKEEWYMNANEMYISELYDMKKKLKQQAYIDWRTPEIIKEWRAINNEIEKVVWIKKNNGSMYILNEIRGKWNELYNN